MAVSPWAWQHSSATPSRNNAPLFQPPKSPASTAISPAFANPTDYFSAGNSRKRQRPDSAGNQTYQQQQQIPRTQQASRWSGTPSWAQQCPTPSDKLYGSAECDPQGLDLVNERYRLANGFDTPSLLHTSSQLPDQHHDEHDFRTQLRDDPKEEMNRFVGKDCAPIFGPLARERNGAGRTAISGKEMPQKTWTGLAIGAIGLVGKVFSFGSTVFRGFSAGGGRRYGVSNQASPARDDSHLATPIPGSWQAEEFLGDFEQDSPSFTQSFTSAAPVRPPNKRRQTDRESWVMVGNPDPEASPPPSAVKRQPRASSNFHQPRSSLAPPRNSASRASSRRTLAPSAIHRSSKASHASTPYDSPPRNDSSRRASMASPRSSGYFGPSAVHMSPEAERFAKRQAKQDRAVEKSMSSMEQRMKDMIRQAQEALGTKVEVEGDDECAGEEDGFVDEDDFDNGIFDYRDGLSRG
ncbi:unnamed protein product [Zymoseptoria tritici ST99CH_3D1]|uniref:Uncharacterized protein n=3 Tax=Zymoseptoria tritici TaxID=1047171 RepID=F9XAZ3_ZYMTI|nr:uncharacterized protein MYCGRDRAFT_93322 [Zymoseptoria tritici IPO323]EGP87539.1 hypothetical protein MYCGRDRAFT_93322 [Zymoseptoria tritici IPO323]SMQ50979.1 unnamed protein product [Zymoseptoria tritici ST99CH_3D7]SMR52898.1 unnamed protein product [Zymoseptoria tritici ST99CH_1E4]SMR54323.1 unnamed protein product [Zymoseptoria tritici ST99CH_3D1]